MNTYLHKVQYYETDRMGITHHSNYIRWMEEARCHYLEQIGWSYEKLEALGVISPVIAVNCQYKKTTTFADEICITTSIKSFKGVKLIIGYEMKKVGEDTVVLTGTSEHCFLDQMNKPIKLKQAFPEFDQLLKDLAQD